MKKTNENPISLFSFQDIVTSLTGIMVIVILVIVLQLVETVSARISKIQPDDEFLQWKAEVQSLQENLKKLQEQGELLSEEVRKLMTLSPEVLAEMINKEDLLKQIQQHESAAVKLDQQSVASKILSIQQERKNLQARLEEAHKENASLQKTLEAVTNQAKKITRLLTLIEEGKQARSNLEVQINNMTPVLEFSFSGSLQRHPLLIECMEDGFRAVVYGQTDVQDFTSGGFSSNLNRLLSWLKTFDLTKSYPVLLYRGNAFKKHGEIENKILDLAPDILLGREPIASGTRIF